MSVTGLAVAKCCTVDFGKKNKESCTVASRVLDWTDPRFKGTGVR
jgi:hypothetical protein